MTQPKHSSSSGISERYDRTWRYVRFCLGVTPQDADDITQDVFLTALEKSRDMEDHRWLQSCASYKKKNWARKKSRQKRLLHESSDDLWLQDSVSCYLPNYSLEAGILIKFLQALGEEERSVFVLKYIVRMSRSEIMQEMGLSDAQARKFLRSSKHCFETRFRESERTKILVAARKAQPSKTSKSRCLATLAGVPDLRSTQTATGTVASKAIIGGVTLGKITAGAVGASILLALTLKVSAGWPNAGASAREGRPGGEREGWSERPPETVEQQSVEPILVGLPPIEVSPSAPKVESGSVREPEPKTLQPLEAVLEARGFVVAGEPKKALGLLSGGVPESAESAVQRQWVATEVAALCRLHRGDDARTKIREWSDQYPGHFSDLQVSSPCKVGQ